MNKDDVDNIIKKEKQLNPAFRTQRFIKAYRLGQYYFRKYSKFNIIVKYYHLQCRFFLSDNNQIPIETAIGENVRFPHLTGIIISADATIGCNCIIFQQVTIGANLKGEAPVIGNNVMIGAGAKIIGKCIIGDNVKIGANAVVTKDVQSGATVIGMNQII